MQCFSCNERCKKVEKHSFRAVARLTEEKHDENEMKNQNGALIYYLHLHET